MKPFTTGILSVGEIAKTIEALASEEMEELTTIDYE